MNHHLLFICICAVLMLFSCNSKKKESAPQQKVLSHADSIALIDFPHILSEKKLKAITLYSSVSYFIYRGQPMGYDYDLCEDFASSLGLKLEIVVAKNVTQLVDMLNNGEGDLVIYNLPVTNELKDKINYSGKESVSNQVLIQQKEKGKPLLTDVTELIGKEVYVQKNTKYDQRLLNLNEELGGGIYIHDINKDSITIEDMIEMVSKGTIPYTVADADIAMLNRTYYNNIDVSLAISFPQRSSWAVRKSSPVLAASLDEWFKENKKSSRYQSIIKRYFEVSKNPVGASSILSVQQGKISIFDHLFKVYAATIGFDWRLLASIAYQESRFDTTATSWAGARGLMQVMPQTFTGMGENIRDINDPEASIRAAAKYLKTMNNSFKSIEDQHERMKFILASYNAGIGHIYDAQALAKKYGKNPHVWTGSVDEFALLKSNPDYYTDSVCRFGYFRGRETYNYVIAVLGTYEYYKTKIKL